MENQEVSHIDVSQVKTGMEIPAKKTRKVRTIGTKKTTKAKTVGAYADIRVRVFLSVPVGSEFPGDAESILASAFIIGTERSLTRITITG